MILCFGETLLRLIPQLGGKWIEASALQTYVGGAELNAAFALAKWGADVAYFTALPDHYLADEVVYYVQSSGINTSRVIRRSGRLGTYYLPQGTDVKNSGVIYDREHSSFAQLTLEELDFEPILQGVSWVHLSAICPALNAEAATISLALLKAAKAKNITTSIDFNYRSKLWQYEPNPTVVMSEITKYCDVLMGNIWAVESLCAIPVDCQAVEAKDYSKATMSCVQALQQQFPQLQTIAFTYRFDDGIDGPNYSGMLFENQNLYISQIYPIVEVADKVGSGDTFMAALIYGKVNDWEPQRLIEFCSRAAVRKLSEIGDHSTSSIAEILQDD